jgi:hypothetical protein
MLNVTDVKPAGTVTLTGTPTSDFDDVSETAKPPAGATDVSSSVPVALDPPTTAFGSTVKDAITGATTLTGTDFVTPANVAVS